jgi:hypothetical protein
MVNVLTRADLYQLVWSTPMSQLAKEFEMSDVGLKKICKAAYVPTPTLGYWAKLKSGKRVSKTPLPVILPFQSQMVYIREKSRYGYVPEAELTDEQLASLELPDPPNFDSSLEEVKATIEALVPRIAIPSKITRVHPVAQTLANAQAKQAAEKYSFHKPKYLHPNGIKVFKALNSLFFYFSSLGFRVRMSGPSSQSLSIDMDGEHHHFRLISLDDPNGVYRKKVVAGKNFGFAWAYEEWRMAEESTYREYEDLTPDVLRELAIELFVKIENGHRRRLEWRYEREVERKREAIERIEKKRAEDAKRKRENVEKLVARRYELIDEALLLISKADQIRELIEAMDKKVESAKKPIGNYRKWRAWAEHQANSIDPRNMSSQRAGRWIEKFQFK